jgi:hypothetical protein
MLRNGKKPSDSNSHQNPDSETHVFSENTLADIHLRERVEEIFEKMISFSQKNQRADAKEQGKRIDVII